MSDSLKAFQFISENIPTWIDLLESLEKKITAREDQVSRVPVPAHKQLKKSGSNESIRLSPAARDAALEVMSAPQDGDMARPLHGQDPAANQRKRKTESVGSHDSIPSKYRTRSLIIVYYDSEIQKGFEEIVRNIGSTMHEIRKAKNSNRLAAVMIGGGWPGLAGAPRSSDGHALLQSLRGGEGIISRPDVTPDGSIKPLEPLELAGLALEKAQSLCERGAHQFLRDGQCESEIIGTRDRFQEAKRIAEEQIARLSAERKEEHSAEDHKPKDTNKDQRGGDLDRCLSNHDFDLEIDEEEEDDEDPLMALARLGPIRRAGGPPGVTVPV